MTKNKKQYKLNLNTRVTVFVKDNHKHKLPSYFAGSNKNKDGSYSTELWDIMYIFGKDLYNGCDVPFIMNEIIIPAEDLEEM